MIKPKKPPTVWHDIASWVFMTALGFGGWWFYLMWHIYRSGGPASMLAEGLRTWQLYATWACLGISFCLYAIGEKKSGVDPFKKRPDD